MTMETEQIDRPPLIILSGPTASGKTALTLDLARHFPIEVISADSRQVYRGMDIGTAKATAQERALVPHHLIDVVDPDQSFCVSDFCRLASRAIADIQGRGRVPLVAGGTGLYIQALTAGLLDAPGEDPSLRAGLLQIEQEQGPEALHRILAEVDSELASRLHPRDRVRIVRGIEVQAITGIPLSKLQKEHGFSEQPYRVLKLALAPEREQLYERIDRRVESMMEQGLVEETRALLNAGFSPDLKAMQTIGYRECLAHLRGEMDLVQAIERIQRDTRRYAKRQMTWFRKDKSIIWVDSLPEFARIHSFIDLFLSAQRSGYGQDTI